MDKAISSFKVTHVLSRCDFAQGGPSRSVLGLVRARGSIDELVTTSRFDDISMSHQLRRAQVRSIDRFKTLKSVFDGVVLANRSDREGEKNNYLFHSHGLWHPLNYAACKYALKNSIPLIVQPRGMLHPWALEWKKYRKRLALFLYQQNQLTECQLLVATSEEEAVYFRRFGLTNDIAVIPNAIEVPRAEVIKENASDLKQINDRAQSKRIRFLFLGRIHPVKGLDLLIKVWATSGLKNSELVIVGPGSNDYLERLKELVVKFGVSGVVRFEPGVSDKDKWKIYRSADFFISPSYSENFGNTVVEALSQGLPVIATHGTPWKGLNTNNCGWWVEANEPSLKKAILSAEQGFHENYSALSLNAVQYASTFALKNVVRDYNAVCSWLRFGTPRPDFVV